jgi:hypothetical protein
MPAKSSVPPTPFRFGLIVEPSWWLWNSLGRNRFVLVERTPAGVAAKHLQHGRRWLSALHGSADPPPPNFAPARVPGRLVVSASRMVESSLSSDRESMLCFLVFGHFSSNQETSTWDNCAIAWSRT